MAVPLPAEAADEPTPRQHTRGKDLPGLRAISDRPSPLQRLRDVWAYRELLRNLIRKELKIKYKNSVLGFAWTLLNPALYLVVFSIVFKVILNSGVDYFAVFLLSGLLAWNLFASSLSGSTAAITGNAQLVQKVWMPREVLAIAPIGAALMHFFFQLTVLIGALLIFQRPIDWAGIPLLFVALAVLLLLCVALGIALSAINVYLRDTQHLLELVLLAWFWFSAIVYPYRQVSDKLGSRAGLMLLNPMLPIIAAFQRVIYNPTAAQKILPDNVGMWWYYRNLLIIGGFAFALLFFSLWLFGRLEDNIAEEI
jgi:ABC-2 type transport system permease protein